MMAVLEWPLQPDETIIWQGRPAPRCYVFRHWLQALLGTLIFLASSFWLMIGYHLVLSQHYSFWLLTVPALLIMVAFIIGPGQILASRLRWEQLFYAVSDQRLFIRSGLFSGGVLSYSLFDLQGYRQRRYGKMQISFRLQFSDERFVVLECLEHPENFIACLPDIGDQVTRKSV